MSDSARPTMSGFLPIASDSVEALVAQRITALRREKDALGRELLRCYEQLNLIFDITENISRLREPAIMRRALLLRCAEMLAAGTGYAVEGENWLPLPLGDSLGRAVAVRFESLRARLSGAVDAVRTMLRAQVISEQVYRDALPEGSRILLGAMRQVNAEPVVLVAIRHPEEPAFDSGDLLATESVLAYGGHTLANLSMMRQLHDTSLETVRALAHAIDKKDNYTCGHSERVGWLARLTGAALGLPPDELDVLEWAGILHDVGKIGIADAILKKPGQLTAEEYEEIKRHPRLSYEVLKPVARLEPILPAVLHHHEDWDGGGYPDGLRGTDIPLMGRIIRVVDMFDALTSTRSYRKGFDFPKAIELLRKEAGRSLDPQVTRVFLEVLEDVQVRRAEEFRQRFCHSAEDGNGIPASTGGLIDVVTA